MEIEPNTTLIRFRSKSEPLSIKDFIAMLKRHDFFDYDWNKKGKGFKKQLEVQTKNGEIVVNDRASGLMWQQSGSSEKMNYDKAKKWIEELNQKRYAGFQDWRLPTLEEAVSLLEPKAKRFDLYLDRVFDRKQWGIWTSDLVKGRSQAWIVSFSLGGCSGYSFYNTNFIRSVRSI